MKELKALGVKVVVFPPNLTYVIQPLDKAVFRSLKDSFREREGKQKTLHSHHAPTLADLVRFWTTAFYESVIAKNILSRQLSGALCA